MTDAEIHPGRQAALPHHPAGEDALLLTGIAGQEALSQLFRFRLDLLAELQTKIPFDRLIGQHVTATLLVPGQEERHFDGIVSQLTQCGRGDEDFVRFHAELVPEHWLLTRTIRSRIFQRLTIPDILRKVLADFPVTYKIAGVYQPRDYCVQYRESDFAFASRLMEEEGIFYFFQHTRSAHQLVMSDLPNQHPAIAGQSTISYDELTGDTGDDLRITRWEKTQELRATEYTVRDHCFELTGKPLEASQEIIRTVSAGKAEHSLAVTSKHHMEIYEYPGGYAQRFDGVNQNGSDQKQCLQQIFLDRDRTVKIRMEQEEAASLRMEGGGNCANFLPGHKFTLTGHFDADDAYLLTRVDHTARLEGDYRSDSSAGFQYENSFTSLPVSLRVRPQRTTARPVIAGSQTATVVGPPGEEIFCDKYGRVKVQFHWDREGKKDSESSCWLRVAQVWAGKGWGAFFWPRVGHEVVVVFEEGDPDQPMIIGSLYNAQNMPPFGLPAMKDFAGIKSASVSGAATDNYSGIVIVDRKGQEHLAIHSERHLVMNTEFDRSYNTGRHHGERVPGARTVTVGRIPGTGGGGSGGGGPNKAVWGPVEPMGILGLNSVVVYGTNVQIACPLNFQLAVGSNLQMCINPNAWQTLYTDATVPGNGATDAFLGAGMGGNMQLTMGTSANFVMGQVFDINLGPKRITLDVHNKAGIQKCVTAIGTVMMIAAAAFLIAYQIDQDDDGRASLVITYQLLMQAALILLMNIQALYNQQDDVLQNAIDMALGVPTKAASEANDAINAFNETLAAPDTALQGALIDTALVAGIMLPMLIESIGEMKLDKGDS